MHAAGEMLFGFIEENANRADTAGGRFINATVATGQSFFIPQGMFSGLILQHTWLFYGQTKMMLQGWCILDRTSNAPLHSSLPVFLLEIQAL